MVLLFLAVTSFAGGLLKPPLKSRHGWVIAHAEKYGCNYLSNPWFQLNHASESGSMCKPICRLTCVTSVLKPLLLMFFVHPLSAVFLEVTQNIKLFFKSYFDTEKAQVVEILPGTSLSHLSNIIDKIWLLMNWRRKEPGHQQPWYWPSIHVLLLLKWSTINHSMEK